VRVASTVYYFSNPGKNPTAMFMRQKYELRSSRSLSRASTRVIRAHRRTGQFLVRFNGQPLPNQKVNLETRNGSKAELVSDAQGVITLHVPETLNPKTRKVTQADLTMGGVVRISCWRPNMLKAARLI